MISMIAAIGENHALGLKGKLPWHLPADFKWFKEKTMGHPIIMGRKTFESFGKPLPGRLHIIISRTNTHSDADNVVWVNSLEAALEIARIREGYNSDEIFIIGGGEIYSQFLQKADRMYLTEVELSPQADAFFPAFDKSDWKVETLAVHEATEDKPRFIVKQFDRI